ncbi:MAG: hypothetical protein QOK48_427 [Blastocatellia bacterium]|jgi:hypothetical protein|nr:hypothetical protein [Blastocatellia bacterium]
MVSRTPIDHAAPPKPKAKGVRTPAVRQRSAEDLLIEIVRTMGESWLPRIYLNRILKLRTRSYSFPAMAKTRGKMVTPEIQHTLLGIELKVGSQRMLCPDLATARYLAVFARAGCAAVAIPYDITRISHLADELESSWHRMLLLITTVAEGRSEAFATRIRSLLIGKVRDEIAQAGAGTRIPEFKQSTKQGRR